MVHGLPLANALKAWWPELSVTWVAEPAPAAVVHHHPAVERVVTFRKSGGPAGVLRLRSDLWPLGPFDLTINAQRYFKSVWPTLFSRGRVRVGLPPDKTRDGVSLLSTHHLPRGPWRHTQEIFLGFLDPLGVPRPEPPEWRITLSEEERSSARTFFERHGRPRVGLVTGTANRAKDWLAERYPVLTRTLEDRGHRVFLLGGPGARERAVARRTMEESGAKPVWAMADSVRELIWKIGGMDLLISPDTGPVHIARAMGVPVIGLYGHTNPWRVGPYRAYEDLVVDAYTDPDEEPDASRYAPRSGRMERIDVEQVLARVELAREVYGVGTGDRGA